MYSDIHCMTFFFFFSENLGALLIEGKTKQIHLYKKDPEIVVVVNKDRITAGDGARAHDLAGKAEIATKTNTLVFEILNKSGKFFDQILNMKLKRFRSSVCIQYSPT